MRRWLAFVARLFSAAAVGQLLTGAAAGACLATLCLQLVLLWGTTPTVSLAMCAAVGVGLAAGCGSARNAVHRPSMIHDALCRFGMATWVVASPWLLMGIERVVSQRAIFDPRAPGTNSLIIFAVALAF